MRTRVIWSQFISLHVNTYLVFKGAGNLQYTKQIIKTDIYHLIKPMQSSCLAKYLKSKFSSSDTQ